MFKELQPILAEGRKVKLTLEAAAEGQMLVYIEPVRKDGNDLDALCTPFLVRTSAEELDAQLSDVLGQWVTARTEACGSVQAALAASKAAIKTAAAEAMEKADSARKKAAPAKGKSTPAGKVRKAPAPTLGLDNKDGEGKDAKGSGASAKATAGPAAVVAAGSTVELF